MSMIFLIGYMAVGKTTVGRALADRCGVRHIDMDDEVVSSEGRSVGMIMEMYGEEGFRRLEQRMLHDVISDVSGVSEEVVVSVGGGTPCFADNMLWMRRAGRCVWLRMGVDGLVERLKGEKVVRPLLARVPDTNLCCVVGRHLAMRRVFYEQADVVVDVDGLSVSEVVDEIINQLNK